MKKGSLEREMKRGFLRKILSTATAVALITASAVTNVKADDTTTFTATKVEDSHYQTLKGEDGNKLTGRPSLTLKKYVSNDAGAADTNKPIQNVVFKYKKIGDLYQVKKGDETYMAYGVEAAFAEAAGIKDKATVKDNTTYYYSNSDEINAGIQAKGKSAVQNYLVNSDGENNTDVYEVKTGENGEAKASNANAYGLYLVAEWDSPEAKTSEGNVSLTGTQNPFVVALPTAETKTENGKTTKYWNEIVVAVVKNNTGEATAEKKIVTNNDINKPELDDTNTVSIGDTVTFRLKGTIPSITKPATGAAETINKYVLTDNISKGLDLIMDTNNQLVAMVKTSDASITLDAGDYNITVADYDSSVAGADRNFAGGKTITVVLTNNGLSKINSWATDSNSPKEIYFYYQAKVTNQAAIGPNSDSGSNPVGNPNEVKLTYQIGSSAEIDTGWDKVTVYSFGINLTKQLNGNASDVTETNRNQIKFALYTKDEETKKYYVVDPVKTGENTVTAGEYKVTGTTVDTAANNVKMSPAVGGVLKVTGLKEGTYYLEELETVDEFNLLKEPVEIKITANKTNNTYTESGNQYVGSIDRTNNIDGIYQFTINNTSGFQLPLTGDAGMRLFVLAGVLVISVGCIYYTISSRKSRRR